MELTDAEKLEKIRNLACVHPRCGEVSYYQASDIDDIVDPPKPKGWIDKDNLPEKNTMYEHKIQDTRTLLRVSADTERIAYFWEHESRFGVGITSINDWNYDFAANVTAVHPPAKPKPERAKVKLVNCQNSTIRVVHHGGCAFLCPPPGRSVDNAIISLRDTLERAKDAAGKPLIEVIIE